MTIAQQFSGQLKDADVDAEFRNLYSGLEAVNRWGQWTNVAYDASLFWSDAGTWTPKAEHVRRFKWTLIGRTLLVDLYLTVPPITGTVKYLFVRVPLTGYKIVPNANAAQATFGAVNTSAAQSGLVVDNSVVVAGIVGAYNNRTDTVVLVAAKLDASAFTNTAGIIAQLAIDVQPQ